MGCSPGAISFGKELSQFLSNLLYMKEWWTHGGCWTLAQALHEYLGDDRTELWGIGSPFAGTAYHVAVKADDCFFDADGASTLEQILKRWKKKFPEQYLIARKLSDNEKKTLLCKDSEDFAVEEMVDQLTLKLGPSELLWRRFFS